MYACIRSLVAAALIAAPFAAAAQDAPESALSWEAGVVSDYLFRGVSQTDENPTFQANLSWAAASGWYLGGALSGVDFGTDSPDVEVDYFVGYGFGAGENVAIDVSLNRYTYPGASELAYNELIATATFADTYSLAVGYSNDVWNSDTTGLYYSLGAEWALPKDFTLSVNVGRNVFRDNLAVEAEDYTDWSIAVGHGFGPVNVSLGYYGTDETGRDNFGALADNRLLLTIMFAN